MNDLDEKTSLSLTVLEEVFNEVDGVENSVSEKSNEEGTELLERLCKFDEEISVGDRLLDKKKKNKNLEDVLKISKNESVVHDGLTDSSDDEDNKYFEEKKYNDSGKNLKTLLERKANLKNSSTINTPKQESTWTVKKTVKEKPKESLGNLSGHHPTNGNLLVDPVLGMRIINPLVSSATLKEKMIGRISISTSKIKQFLESSSKDTNWVTGGAIVGKAVRTSQKGNQYCIWHLTDLTGDIKTISVFLFGSAYKDHWKTSVGMVVGILNPATMDSTGKNEVTLRVDNTLKILLMGVSKDFGLCKSKKKNGENCMSVVNKSKCDFCIYHIKEEYNKACRRSDLQPPKIGRSLDNLRAKVLGKNQVCLGGKIYNRVVGKKSSKQTEKDERRLQTLSQRNQGNLSETEKQKTTDLLNRLNNSDKQGMKTPPAPTPQPRMIDLDFTITKKERNAARANALKYIKKHGPLKPSSSDGKAKKTPEQISAIKRKLETPEENENKKAKFDTPTNSLKEKQLKNGITDEFLKLMTTGARNLKLLKMAETEERDKYFDKLEMKEKLENKMATTFKVPCKAVRCLKCNYKSFSASDLCKKEKHPLKVIDAFKRFWKCKNCSARTVSLELIPLHTCKNCGSSSWEKTSMMKEKKDGNLIVEPLSLRGHEEQFLGSTVKNANLNLLVPEEAS